MVCICVLAGFLSYCCEHGVPPYVMIIDRDEDQLASSVSVVEGNSRDIAIKFGITWDIETITVLIFLNFMDDPIELFGKNLSRNIGQA